MEATRRPLLTIELGVKRKLSRRNDPDAALADAEFARVRPGVLSRDKCTCRGCTFASRTSKEVPAGFMEVHHIDDDHRNQDPKNLATLCPYCHMPFTLGRRGAVFAGDFGWLPEISQDRLNLMCHTIFGLARAVEILKETGRGNEIPAAFADVPSKAIAQWSALRAESSARLRNEIEPQFPEIDSAETLYVVLQELPSRLYDRRAEFMGGLRIFPKIDLFRSAIDYWARNVWIKATPPSTWMGLVQQAAEGVYGGGQ